jgi:mRNA deadenylase 3'-5' endonuclease subunit Ccr4
VVSKYKFNLQNSAEVETTNDYTKDFEEFDNLKFTSTTHSYHEAIDDIFYENPVQLEDTYTIGETSKENIILQKILEQSNPNSAFITYLNELKSLNDYKDLVVGLKHVD